MSIIALIFFPHYYIDFSLWDRWSIRLGFMWLLHTRSVTRVVESVLVKWSQFSRLHVPSLLSRSVPERLVWLHGEEAVAGQSRRWDLSRYWWAETVNVDILTRRILSGSFPYSGQKLENKVWSCTSDTCGKTWQLTVCEKRSEEFSTCKAPNRVGFELRYS